MRRSPRILDDREAGKRHEPAIAAIVNSGWAAPLPQQTVAFGLPAAEALPRALRQLSMNRVAVVTTNSLTGAGGIAENITRLLGNKLHTIISGVQAHTPRRNVVRVARELEGADGVVTIGGSSVHDTVKAARLCLANGVTQPDDIDRFRARAKKGESSPDDGDQASIVLPSLPFVAIPTTLSAGEFTSGVGITDERGPVKQVFIYQRLAPDIVILDPEMTRQTPARLFFASGMRAVDHAVESWCAINPTPLSDACSLQAVRLLIGSMRSAFGAPDDMQARLNCQEGAWLSIILGSAAGVKTGASHGMGHALGGTAGMLHGDTSCVMLPHILRYNAPVNGERQAVIAATVGSPAVPLADIIENLVSYLGLPSRLRDVGIEEHQLDAIAVAAIKDARLRNNPRPIEDIAEARELLQRAW
jgi:maleylacetate reductase